MIDEGHQLTDEELEKLERKIVKVYKQAADELQETINDYFASFKKRDAEMQALIGTELNGKTFTQEDYNTWRLAQIGRGERYKVLQEKVAERYTKANETALAYVNDKTPTIYTLNRNYAAYTIEQIHGVDFTLWNEQAVRRMIVESPETMPYYPEAKALKRGIDLAYGKQQISKTITSSILQGKALKGMADDLQKNIKNMSRASAIRAARTAFTSAENGGRQAQYEAAADMGLKVKRQWHATLDFRTRHEHGEADGQIVGVDEPFTVGGEKLMFPGDPSGSGWNVYNCRCKFGLPDDELTENHMQRVKVEKVDPETGKVYYDYELKPKLSYKQWVEEKKADGTYETGMKKVQNKAADTKQMEKYRNLLGKDVPNRLADFQHLKYNNPDKWDEIKKKAREAEKEAKK